MILFIEDDAITQFIYQDWFSDNSKFLFVENLAEAKSAISNNKISCVVSDIHLPDGLIFELGDLINSLNVPIALAFGSNLIQSEKEMLKSFTFDIQFRKPLEKAVLQNWFKKVNVL